MRKHWTEADFLDRLYEVGREDRHLEECGECRAKWEQWVSRRGEVVERIDVPAAFLARQRREIEQRLDRRSYWSNYVKWSPALAFVCVAFLALAWRTPTAPKAVRDVASHSSDAQLMSEIYDTVSGAEPDMVEPLHGLFEVKK